MESKKRMDRRSTRLCSTNLDSSSPDLPNMTPQILVYNTVREPNYLAVRIGYGHDRFVGFISTYVESGEVFRDWLMLIGDGR